METTSVKTGLVLTVTEYAKGFGMPKALLTPFAILFGGALGLLEGIMNGGGELIWIETVNGIVAGAIATGLYKTGSSITKKVTK